MNQMTANDSDDRKVVDLAESPGRRLRVQRQSRGIEIERIATQLHLRNDVVEALEQDRYDALPAPVYVAGYLRNYARLIGLDPTAIVNAYYAATPRADDRMTQVVQAPGPRRERQPGNLRGRLIGLAIAGAVIVTLTLWWQNRADQGAERSSDWLQSLFGQAQSQTVAAEDAQGLDDASPVTEFDAPEPDAPEPVLAEQPTTAPAESDAPAPAPPTSPTTPAPALLPEPVSAQPGGLPGASQPAAVGVADSAEEPEPAVLATAASAVEVMLEFTGASWVSVMGSDGNVVLNGEMRAGDRRVLEGQPPYKFVIGNASATRMTLGGNAFDLTGRSRGNVARFTLDPLNPQ